MIEFKRFEISDRLVLTDQQESQLRVWFPAIGRLKPDGYFGVTVDELRRDIGVTDEQLRVILRRTKATYEHYWGTHLGNRHCFELEQSDRASAEPELIKSMLHTPRITPDATVIALPSVKLYRLLKLMPRIEGKLRYTAPRWDVSPLFARIPIENIDTKWREWLSTDSRGDTTVWLSKHECDAAGIDVSESEEVAYVQRAAVPSPDLRAIQCLPWELLSMSVEIAHRGRLSGELGLWNAAPTVSGLVQAGVARGVMARVVRDAELNERALGSIGIGVAVMVDDTVDQVTKASLVKDQGLFIRSAPRELFIDAGVMPMGESVIMSSLATKKQASDIISIDKKALVKGGIHD